MHVLVIGAGHEPSRILDTLEPTTEVPPHLAPAWGDEDWAVEGDMDGAEVDVLRDMARWRGWSVYVTD